MAVIVYRLAHMRRESIKQLHDTLKSPCASLGIGSVGGSAHGAIQLTVVAVVIVVRHN